MEKKRIKILIADDHSIFRTGLINVLKPIKHIEVIGEAIDGRHLLKLAAELKPDVILTDIVMPIMDGVSATKELIKRKPETRIIALSMFAQDDLIIDMLEAGVAGYMLKNATRDEVVEAIETVNAHAPYFCRQVTEKITNLITKNNLPNRNISQIEFSDREKEIIRLICEEYTTKEIAAILRLSVRTTETHRFRIMERIGAKSLAGIITYAIRAGIYTVYR